MKNLTVYIADADVSFAKEMILRINAQKGMQIIGHARTGSVALNDLWQLAPDVLLLDLQLPGIDGVSLLKSCKRFRRPPVCIVCTRFYSGYFMEQASACGADCFLLKPVEPDRLIQLIVDCCKSVRGDAGNAISANDSYQREGKHVEELLRTMGFPAKLCGSLYLLEATLLLREHPLLIRNLNGALYAQLASRLNATPARIERSIRNAISIAYERGNLKARFAVRPTCREVLNCLFHDLNTFVQEKQSTSGD